MEIDIDIAKILKNKSINTKLYSPLFGNVYTSSICNEDTIIVVKHHTEASSFYNNGKYLNYVEAEPLLFPSKEMRNWSKFNWKRGDVLVTEDGSTKVIFECFEDDTYLTFKGKYCLQKTNIDETFIVDTNGNLTECFSLQAKNIAQIYLHNIEDRIGGRLNMETLEVEKGQPEFKDGDIVVAEEDNYYDKVIFIAAIKDDIVSKVLINVRYKDYEVHYNEYRFGRNRSLRLATDSEKQQLFDALAKEGKAWDAEKKMVVNLKPKVEFKPFDKVLVRNYDCNAWQISLFGYKNSLNCYYCCNGSNWIQCIPYKGNEHLLGTKF